MHGRLDSSRRPSIEYDPSQVGQHGYGIRRCGRAKMRETMQLPEFEGRSYNPDWRPFPLPRDQFRHPRERWGSIVVVKAIFVALTLGENQRSKWDPRFRERMT